MKTLARLFMLALICNLRVRSFVKKQKDKFKREVKNYTLENFKLYFELSE